MQFEEGKFLVLKQEYTWEPSSDIYRDVDEAVAEIIDQHGGEFKGKIKVTITYED